MKNNLVLFLLLLTLISVSCNKKKDEPTPDPVPYLEIKFGYYPISSFTLKPFLNQSSVPFDSIIPHQFFGVSISELNHLRNISINFDSLVFKFNIQTKNDLEYFISKKNTKATGLSLERSSTAEVTGEFGLPYKISAIAIKGNDTLEFAPTGDLVKLNYISAFSSLNGSANLSITK